jgi:ABC-2 type transport system ATP-binding protein
MRALSGGMKRRVLVAQALVHKPPVIVLDEPTAGVDVELRHGLWQFVRRINREGHTIVLTTHYLEEAEAHCQRIAMLKEGRVAALDTTRNLLGSFSGVELRIQLDRDALPSPFPGRLVARDGARFTLRLGGYDELEQALARLREARIGIVEMELEPPDLEEAFLRVTGRA